MSTLAPVVPQTALRSAMQAGNLEDALAAFAPDAIVNSPLTAKFSFQGQDQIRAILAVILDIFKNLEYTDELLTETSAVLVGRTKVGREKLEFVDHLKLNADGKISEMTVFFRPLPATVTAMRLIGRGLGRRRSRAYGRLLATMILPLVIMVKRGDGIGVRLIRKAI
jgi:hypothetical protein